jgi:hypothetical protein
MSRPDCRLLLDSTSYRPKATEKVCPKTEPDRLTGAIQGCAASVNTRC